MVFFYNKQKNLFRNHQLFYHDGDDVHDNDTHALLHDSDIHGLHVHDGGDNNN